MSYKYQLKQIKAFVFDVDGVFTDGSVFLMPGGHQSRVMNVLDGYAVIRALKSGYKIGVITGGDDPMVRYRLNYLGITDYFPKSSDKLKDLEAFKSKYDLKDSQLLMMGDDIPDLAILRKVALATCPVNAVPEVKAICQYISPVKGGKGAVRDVIEQVLKVNSQWIEDHTQSR